MTSPYIRLTKAAITAKLTQNEGLIFHALMMQTLGFRKTIDNLTDKRLAKLAGIRIDHFRPALEGFLCYNLFHRIEHRDYDYQYRICDEFLDDTQSTIVYPPTLPKTGETGESRENFPKGGTDFPPTSGKSTELGTHTTENLYIKKPPQQKTPTLEKQPPQTETKKTDFIKKQPPPKTEKTDFIEKKPQPFVTKISMIGLEIMPEQFVIESSGSVRFEFSAKTTENVIQTTEKIDKPVTEPIVESIAETCIAPIENPIFETNIKPVTESVIEPIVEPIAETRIAPIENPIFETSAKPVIESIEPIVKPIAETHIAPIENPIPQPITQPVAKAMQSTTAKTIGELATAIIPSIKPTTQAIAQDTTKPVVVADHNKKKKKPLAVPKVVGEVNMKACNNHFQTLNEQQQKDVLMVFYHMLKVSKIRSKANYFISLTRSAKEDSLTLPTEAIAATQSQTPEAIAKRKAANKEREKRMTYWSNYCWIKEQAILQNKSEEELAKTMGFEKPYAMFGEQQACVA